MNKLIRLLGVILLGASLVSCTEMRPGSLSPYPLSSREEPAGDKAGEAAKLCEYARTVNPRLKWDECLAQKAQQRAKWLVERNSFAHKDPRTGKNPAWDLIAECVPYKCVGENLGKGDDAASIHEAWMTSPTHRENMQDPRYTLLGIGCYGQICVQLFVGL